jgi:hypothetical protein
MEPLSSATLTLDKGSLCRVSTVPALGKEAPVGPFACSFVECTRRHSTKAPSLLSASWHSSWQQEHQWTPLLVPLPSTFGGTRQRFLVCRVSQPQHSAKKLYRFPGVPSLPSVALGKVTRTPFLFVFAISSKQTKDISHNHHIYTSQISQNRHIHQTHDIAHKDHMFLHKDHNVTSTTNSSQH